MAFDKGVPGETRYTLSDHWTRPNYGSQIVLDTWIWRGYNSFERLMSQYALDMVGEEEYIAMSNARQNVQHRP